MKKLGLFVLFFVVPVLAIADDFDPKYSDDFQSESSQHNSMAEHCVHDIERFCSDLPKYSARMYACLDDHRDDLSDECEHDIFMMDGMFPTYGVGYDRDGLHDGENRSKLSYEQREQLHDKIQNAKDSGKLNPAGRSTHPIQRPIKVGM